MQRITRALATLSILASPAGPTFLSCVVWGEKGCNAGRKTLILVV
jgi:hypothetical protein